MRRKIAIILLFIFITNVIPVNAAQLSDPVFESATVTLSPEKIVTISLDTQYVVPSIEIKKCWIEREESGNWVTKHTFIYTGLIATNTISYTETLNYSNYITLSGKYRIKCTVKADGHSLTIYSTPRTF